MLAGSTSGSNNIPLGSRGGLGSDSTVKRGRSPTRQDGGLSGAFKKRKRKTRWGSETENRVANLMNIATTITGRMTPEQIDAYVLHIRIEEISQKLRINDVVPKDRERSPSPPPQYDSTGKRINTREYRYRKGLEDERHKLVERALKTIPDFRPPPDYRRPLKTQEKIYVPVNDYPEINFIGQLIGPRGNTLKKMQMESGAKIAIRGKGSVKEGKGRSDAAHTSSLDEDLHCLIIADSEDKIQKAIKLVNLVIERAASVPEGENDLKRSQLRELATLNGTLRDDENQACQNCGEIGHRKYDCPNRQNFTANVVCRICGNAGHFARDCKERPAGFNGSPGMGEMHSVADKEYEQLMLELGTNGGGNHDGPAGLIERPPPSSQSGGAPPPWANRDTGGVRPTSAAPWSRPQADMGSLQSSGGGAAPPPWATRPPPPPGPPGQGFTNSPPVPFPPGDSLPPPPPWQRNARPENVQGVGTPPPWATGPSPSSFPPPPPPGAAPPPPPPGTNPPPPPPPA